MKTHGRKINWITIMLICIIGLVILWIGIQEYIERKIGKIENSKYVTEKTSDSVKREEEKVKQYPKEKIIQEYYGYDVCAKLVIPKIDLETYILTNYSTNALNVSVTKFWGANPNETGNFCVAGHNFVNKNMFRNLRKLEIGDTLSVSDNKVGKVEYEIYQIEKVYPKDVRCLDQNTENKEITLITCTNNSEQRIIVKAKEMI